jgi:hypothetical protein
MLERSVEALPEGVIVEPNCVVRLGGVHGFVVVSPSGNVAGNPAFDQLMARLGDRMPDHDCPKHGADKNNMITLKIIANNSHFMILPMIHFPPNLEKTEYGIVGRTRVEYHIEERLELPPDGRLDGGSEKPRMISANAALNLN